jgi:hypothetical protein
MGRPSLRQQPRFQRSYQSEQDERKHQNQPDSWARIIINFRNFATKFMRTFVQSLAVRYGAIPELRNAEEI